MSSNSIKDLGYLLVGGYNVATIMDHFTAKHTAGKQEFRPCGSTWPINIDLGMRTAELQMSGVLNSPTSDAVSAVNGTDRAVSALIEGNTVSARFWGFQAAIVDGVEVGVSPDAANTLLPSFSVDGEVNYGWVVAPHATRTTAGNTDATYADIGAGVSAGHVYLHVTALDLGGGTSCTIKLRGSADHITFADETTMTAVTAIGSEVKALASAVERYLSVSWAWTGGSNQSIDFFLGVAAD